MHFEECCGQIKWDPITGKCCRLDVGSLTSQSDDNSWEYQISTKSLMQLKDCHVSRPVAFSQEYCYMNEELFPAPLKTVQDVSSYKMALLATGILIGFCIKNSIPVELP